MKKLISLFTLIVILFGFKSSFAQTDNFITQYDPYIITLKKFTFYYPVDEDPVNSSSKVVIVIKGNIGTQKNAFIKFVTTDMLAFETAREYEDGYIQEVSVLDNKGALIPPLKNINGQNFLELTIAGYADLSDTDFEKIKKITNAGVLAVATSLNAPFKGIYKNYPLNTGVLMPTDEKWAEAEAFLAGMNTRPKVDLGSVTFNVPMITDVKNIVGGDNLVPGDKTIAEEKGKTIAIVNFKELKDDVIVYDQPYYQTLLNLFLKHAGQPSNKDNLTADVIELTDFKAQGFKDREDVYINPEAKKQLGYVLDVLIAAVPIKNDTVETTDATLPLDLQIALDYFKANLISDKTRFNKYIFDTYISDERNRAKMKRETDAIRKYYNYPN